MNSKGIAVAFLKMASAGEVSEAYTKFVGGNFLHHNAFFEGTAKALQAGMEEKPARIRTRSLR